MHKTTMRPVLCLVIIALFVISSNIAAKVKAVTGQLSLMATLDGKPAFRSVLWRLTPTSSNKDLATIHIHKHAATLDLEPGGYQVSVSLGSKTRTYELTIKESSKQELIVNLD